MLPSFQMNNAGRENHFDAALLLLLLVVTLVYGWIVLRQYQPYTYLKYDPGWAAEAVLSIANDSDLDLRNQLGYSLEAAGDQTALGSRGEWYPVHEILISIAAVPFFRALGINGLLCFNFLAALLLAAGCYSASARFAGPIGAFFGAFATALSPVCCAYVYSFSSDLLGATLLIWAFVFAVNRRWLLCGLLVGAAVFGRMVNGFSVPAFILFVFIGSAEAGSQLRVRLRVLFDFFLGALPFALAFFAANTLMFGGPLEMSYGHWMHGDDGAVFDQTRMFTLPTLASLGRVLDLRTGLLAGAPLIGFAGLFGIAPLWRTDRQAAILLIAAAVCILGGTSMYMGPYVGYPGNRYLLGLTALTAAPMALALERIAPGLR